jgi:3-phosphoglycerate kinase
MYATFTLRIIRTEEGIAAFYSLPKNSQDLIMENAVKATSTNMLADKNVLLSVIKESKVFGKLFTLKPLQEIAQLLVAAGLMKYLYSYIQTRKNNLVTESFAIAIELAVCDQAVKQYIEQG